MLVRGELEQGFENVYCAGVAFVVQTKKGKVVAWGDGNYSGSVSGIRVAFEQVFI